MKCTFLIIIYFHITSIDNANAINFTTATVKDVQQAIQSGSCTCQQIIRGYLERINAYNRNGPQIGGIISTNRNALLEASMLDNFYAQNRRLVGILHCAPLIVKDNIDIAGLPTTNGLHVFRVRYISVLLLYCILTCILPSNILQYMYPQMDATVVRNAKQAGAILLGKANMSPLSDKESFGNSETGGLIRNPYGLSYTSYGSSGGNGASGAAMFTILGYGVETGMSINLPSSAANLVGLRPPVSLLSNLLDGALPNSKPQDAIGPMAKTVEDVALLLDAEVGNSQTKRYSAPEVLRQDGLRGARLNILKYFTYDEQEIPNVGHYKVDDQIVQLFNNMVNSMVGAGAIVRNVTWDIPKTLESFVTMTFKAVYDTCLMTWRNQYFENPMRYGPTAPLHSVADVVRTGLLPEHYQKVWTNMVNVSSPSKCDEEMKFYNEGRQKFINDVITPLLDNADVVFWPAMPIFPIKLTPEAYAKNYSAPVPSSMINFINAGSWSGYATINLPIGFSQPLSDAPDGLPAAAILLAKPENLEKLLTIAYAYQKNFGISKVPYSVPELPHSC